MLDVHPPHGTPHGWRDFMLHIGTITIGLLIALSFEGILEWQHHRHLAHAAETSLHTEIRNNASSLGDVLSDVRKRKAELREDVTVLKVVIATSKFPDDHHMSLQFDISGFDSVAWKTAQTTGALSYMPYDLAQEYSSIYQQQDLVAAAENQAARDTIVTVGPFIDGTVTGDTPPSSGDAKAMIDKIEVIEGQLLLLESLLEGQGDGYKAFLAEHPY